MYNVSPMFDALAERFDDMDEIKDVAEYGCAAGVSDFIYSAELVPSLTSTRTRSKMNSTVSFHQGPM